jgi:CubicO group peptidase (beta-lactamase class C family)
MDAYELHDATVARIAGALFTQQRELLKVPRMAGGVVIDGKLVSAHGFGADEHSLFRIASMTKSFTASAMLILRDEGRLALDDPIARHAPEYASLEGPTSDSAAITIRHLLTMSSALATDDAWGDRHLDITDADLDVVVTQGPAFASAPGMHFEYSNLGYAILGRIIHRVTGQRPQAFITDRLLEPLGMTETVWDTAAAVPSFAGDFEVVEGVRADGVTAEVALGDGGLATMGGLWSTVSDLATWIGFFTEAYPPRDDRDHGPLRRSSRREMQAMHTFVAPDRSTSADGATRNNVGGYGMGLLIMHHDQLGEIAGHSGGLPGYGSNMRWVKGTGVGVVALANMTYARMADTTARVLDALHAGGVASGPTIALAPALSTAGLALFELLMNWSDSGAEAVFADNVAPDQSYHERRLAAAALAGRYPGLRLARMEAESHTTGRLVAHGLADEIVIEFSLAPLRGGRVQYYELPD